MSPKGHRHFLIRCAIAAVLGALPGVLIAEMLSPRIGAAVAALGTSAGALLYLPGVSPVRTLKLLIALVVARNLPASSWTLDWVDRGTPPVDDPTGITEAFTDWVLAKNIRVRRGWLVLFALLVGLLVGGAIAVHDVQAISANHAGLALPLKGSRDTLPVQGVILAIAFAIWTASAVGVIAAPAYRRPLLVCVPFAAFLGYAVGYAADNGRGTGPLGLALFASSSAATLALLVAAFMTLDAKGSE